MWTLLSTIEYGLKDWDAAIKNATEAILLDPNYADGYCIRGTAYYEKKEIKDALSDIHKAFTLNPNNKKFSEDLSKIIGEVIKLNPKLRLELLNKTIDEGVKFQ